MRYQKIAYIVLAVVLLAAGCIQKVSAPAFEPTVNTYHSSQRGFTIEYSPKLKVLEAQDSVVLNHSVAFPNTGACDMKGDSTVYPNLDDFNVTIKILPKPLVESVKQQSPYMPAENFDYDTLKTIPGFIDSYQAGSLKGYAIYEGAEGCGHTIYYFPLSSLTTLVVTRDMVQLFSTAVTGEAKSRLLNTPGVIPPEEADRLFNQVLTTFKLDK